MRKYREPEGYKDKCNKCKRAYNTTKRIKWWLCNYRDLKKHSTKVARCLECVVKKEFVEKTWGHFLYTKKILAESGEFSVEALNSKDFCHEWHTDTGKQKRELEEKEQNQRPSQPQDEESKQPEQN